MRPPYIAKVWHEWRREDYTDRPRYVHQPTPIAEGLDAVLVDVLILMGWSVVFFLGADLSFLRYDVI